MNKIKSNIIQIIVDRRTRHSALQTLGIPIVNSTKYLGVMIDDDLSFRTEITSLNESLKKIKV